MSFARSMHSSRMDRAPIAVGAFGVIALTLLLTSQSPILALALGIALVLAVAILRAPWIAYLLLVASVPAQQFVGVPIGGQIVTATQMSFLGAVGALAVWILAGRHPVVSSSLLIPIGLLLGVMLISSFFADHFGAALTELARWVVTITAFILGLQFIPRLTEGRVTVFVIALALGGVFEAGFGVVQSVLALGPESFLLNSGVSRAFGTFGKPNTYAAFLEIVLFPVLALGLYYGSRTVKSLKEYRFERVQGFESSASERHQLLLHGGLSVVLLGSAAITLSGIAASLSRGAWLGVLAGLAVTGFLAFRWVRLGTVIVVPVVALLIASGGAGFAPEPVAERISSGAVQLELLDPVTTPITDENFATLERLAHWHAGVAMFEESPLVGVGVGNFDPRYDDFFVRQEFRFSRGHAHNYYIHTLAETGILGLFAYVWLVGSVGGLALLTVRRSDDHFHRAVALGGLGMVIAVSVHNLVENLHVLNLGITQAFVWSLVVAASRSAREAELA